LETSSSTHHRPPTARKIMTSTPRPSISVFNSSTLRVRHYAISLATLQTSLPPSRPNVLRVHFSMDRTAL
jgi:hypothetical protein